MIRTFTVCSVVLLVIAAGCGGNGDLGSIGGEPVTREQYLEVFNGLPAEEQVSVLEPGGRMALMERVIRKRLLLAAWAEDPSISEPWEKLYSVSVFSDSMFRRIAMEFDSRAFTDSLTAAGYSGFTLRTVLLADSLQAATLAEEWNAGNLNNSVPSVSAPWSSPGSTSSYRVLSGPVHMLTSAFFPFLDMETGKAHVIPLFGEWCIGLLELEEGQWVEDDVALSAGLLNHVSMSTGEIIFAPGVRELAEICAVSGTVLVPAGEGSGTPVIITENDTLTVNDFTDMMELSSAENFFGGVPDELLFSAPPELSMSPELTVWLYVSSVGQRFALAELAAEAGIAVPAGIIDYARAESVVRERVLLPSIPDSAAVAEWYSSNSDMYILPERRSVLLGYSTGEAPDPVPESFEQVDQLQTILDENGDMVPTPAQVERSFGEILGPEVFAAEEGAFSGPVSFDGELAAWFQVVEIIPPGVASLDEIYPVVASAAANEMFTDGFEMLIENLRSAYPVEMDTTAVVELDLWGGMR